MTAGQRDTEVLSVDCPVRRLLRVVGDKWTPVVMHALSGGAWRFSDLQRAVPDISRKMLTQVLRNLQASGVVERTVYPAVPPKTDYRLTELGRRLHEPMALLCRWGNENKALLDRMDGISPAASPE